MMINEIIVNYLVSNKRLVIPTFGAFLKKENNTITFVELLKKDDEVLNSLVSKSMGVSHESAESIINDFIKSIKEEIEKNGTYLVGTIGALVVGANGVYGLVPAGSGQIEPKVVVKPSVVAQNIENNSAVGAEKEPDLKPETPKVAPAVTPAVTAEETQLPPQVSQAQVKPIVKPIAKPISTPINKTTIKSPVKRGVYSQSETKEPSEQYTLQKRGTKKQMDIFMIIAIIAAILALALLVYGAMVSNEMPDFNL